VTARFLEARYMILI